MAKRSQRRTSRHERDQAGCIWGLISIFDLRQGRSTRRLLSDRRRVSKHDVGAGDSSTQTILPDPTKYCETVVDAEESKMPMADIAKTSVKELMEEEMSNEQGSMNQPNESELGLEQTNSKNGNHTKKNQKRRKRSSAKSSDMDILPLEAAECLTENLNQKPLDNLDLEKIMEELANDKGSVVEEKLVAAVKLFIEQKLSNSNHFGDEDKLCCSKEWMDALQTLNSNKTVFLKSLKDPNSVLVKHMQDVEGASLPESDLSKEKKPANLKPDELSNRKTRNFFRRRSKSLDSCSLMESQSPNKIVILKPGPVGAQSPETDIASRRISFQSEDMDYRAGNEKHASHFSFTEIKRRLRHAMGKERHDIVSPDRVMLQLSRQKGNKVATGESFGWSSPNRNHFYTERLPVSPSPSFKKGEPVGKLKDKGSPVLSETGQYSRLGGSNIYAEAKKHLSEMVKNGEENADSATWLSGQLPKPLGRILSLPEYNGTPCCSPIKPGDDIFITAQMKLSPLGIVKNNVSGSLQEHRNNHPSRRRLNLESQPSISSSNSEDNVRSLSNNVDIPLKDDQECSLEIQSFNQDSILLEVQRSSSIIEEIGEPTDSRPKEEENSINVSSEALTSPIDEAIQKGDSEESDSQLLKESSPCTQWSQSELFGEDKILSSPTVSPSHSPVGTEVEASYSAIKVERPSPVSVLEPLFKDDDISPPSTISQPVEKEIEPRHIHFDEPSSATVDQETCIRISLEDEESPFEYVEAVLLGSGLNWDDFLTRWLSLYEILDSSLFDEVELFSSRPRHDQKLLFDCANEALKEVCESYFGCYTGISRVKPNIQMVPKGMDLINEVWDWVEWHLLQQAQPRSLEQLIKTDLSRSGKWMNLQSDIEVIGFEMEENMFNELVEDIVLSFVDNTSECEFAVTQGESNTIEDIPTCRV